MRTFWLAALCCGILSGQVSTVTSGTFEGAPALVLSNGRLTLHVTATGASLARLVLNDDASALNPFWEPARMTRELGGKSGFRPGTGHFVCVDGFGPVSEAERLAGLPGHGEAHVVDFQTVRSTAENGSASLSLAAVMPIVLERFTRTVHMNRGENVVYVESSLENLLGFDRPVNWAEHATIGSPFLASGDTVVDVSGSRSLTRPYQELKSAQSDRRLASGVEFTWPLAPALDGGKVDLRLTPPAPHYLDHATTLVDETQRLGWTTAINTAQRLIIGYVFRRAEYPWVQYWGNYPPTGKMSRGLEFSSQPFDVSRRDVLSTPPLFGAPVYRWLPAKGTLGTRFILFYARVPENLKRVDSLRIEDGQIRIEDRTTGARLALGVEPGFL